jgi:hypothetical protein
VRRRKSTAAAGAAMDDFTVLQAFMRGYELGIEHAQQLVKPVEIVEDWHGKTVRESDVQSP